MTATDLTRAVAEAAGRLRSAAGTATPCPPVRDVLGAHDIAAAYAVQRLNADHRLAAGATVSGRKIGLTNPVVQRQLGVDQPDFGVLFADMDVTALPEVPTGALLQPKVEAEIAFVLGGDLDAEDLTYEDVRAAVAFAAPALEIVASRVAGWDITITDTVADNASCGLYVLGDARRTLEEFEPRDAVMRVVADGATVSTGTGAACLDDPLNALLWLARTAAAYGDPLRAGQVVLSGALGPMVTVTPGMAVHAEIDGLGSVSARFSDPTGVPATGAPSSSRDHA